MTVYQGLQLLLELEMVPMFIGAKQKLSRKSVVIQQAQLDIQKYPTLITRDPIYYT